MIVKNEEEKEKITKFVDEYHDLCRKHMVVFSPPCTYEYFDAYVCDTNEELERIIKNDKEYLL